MAGLRTWIAAAAPGARIPSNRALTAEYAASPVTVQKAVQQLVRLGLVEARPGVGTFVRAARTVLPADYGWQAGALGAAAVRLDGLSSAQRPTSPDAIGLHSGYPAPDLLPERLVRQALVRASRTASALTRSPAAGEPGLQEWFAAELAAAAPAGITVPTARDAVIISGSQSGLSSIFRAVVGVGRPLLIESPTYWGALLAAEQAGVVLVPVPSGPQGPDPAAVDRALAETGARAFYAHGHVVYLRSLTKSVSPSLRVAAVIARGPARDRILADRAAESMYVSGLLQTAALDVVTQPAWRTHLRGFREQLRSRRDLLLSCLAAQAPTALVEAVPVGGLNLWLRLPDGTDAAAVVRECAARGLVIAPGSEWFPAEPSGAYVRLNYASADPSRFPEAAAILGAVLAGS